MNLSLSQELLLLAIRPDTGRIARGHELGFALAGAALADLALAERIQVPGRTVVLIDERPTGDRAADLVLARIATGKPRACSWWVSRLAGRMVRVAAESLANAEVVATEKDRVLGIVPVTRHRVVRPDVRNPIEARVRRALSGGAAPGDRTRAIVGLVHAAGLLGPLAPGWSRGQLTASVRRLSEGDWATSAVRTAIAEAQAASAAAGVAATVAVVASG